MKDTSGKEITAGCIITTWDHKTEYKVVEDKGILVLEGIKPLSYVGIIPTIVGYFKVDANGNKRT